MKRSSAYDHRASIKGLILVDGPARRTRCTCLGIPDHRPPLAVASRLAANFASPASEQGFSPRGTGENTHSSARGTLPAPERRQTAALTRGTSLAPASGRRLRTYESRWRLVASLVGRRSKAAECRHQHGESGLGLFHYPPIRSDNVPAESARPAPMKPWKGVRFCASRSQRRACRHDHDRRTEVASLLWRSMWRSSRSSFQRQPVSRSTNRAVPNPAAHESIQLPRLVFLLQPGPGGGGGGGGNKQPREPSPAQAIGRDRLTVPVARRADVRQSQEVAPPLHEVLLDAKPLASGTTVMPGLFEASPSLPFSRGPGSGEGVGTGTGAGIGSGTGPGVGAGGAADSAAALTAWAAAWSRRRF